MPDPTSKSKASEILARLEELTTSLRRRPADRPEDDDIDPADKRTLAGRLSVVTGQRTAAEEAAASALKLVAELRAAHEADLAALRVEAAQSVVAGVRRVEQGYALRALMVEPDEDGVTAAHRLYESLPENKRPDNIVEWWKGLAPENAPKTLRPYLAASVVEPAPIASATRQPPRVDVGRGKATEPDPATMDGAAYEAYLASFAQRRDAERLG
jgi:hypothetical protein